MFDFGFTKDDLKRTAWSFGLTFVTLFVGGLAGVWEGLATSCKAGACDWNTAGAALAALAGAAVVGAFVTVKNLILADRSALKG